MIKNFIAETIETILTSAIVIFVIYSTIALPEKVVGASMEPTFYTGERILVERITKHYRDFKVGEVIVLHPPDNKHVDFIKRVVALPGDIIKVHNCEVYVLRDSVQFKLSEPYLAENTCTTEGVFLQEGKSIRLANDEYMVFGDNRSNSSDSRYFGTITKENIIGRVIFRFWPLSAAGFVN